MFSDERHDQILALLERNGRVLAKELADHFGMSIDSIRRDLTMMEQKGLLKRTHGGAIPAISVRQAPLPPDQRYGEAAPHQDAISKLAATFIRERDTVFLGSAGIQFGMLKHLPLFPFTVITNATAVANVLKDRDNVDVYLLGGLVKRSGSITDALAQAFLRQFTIDTCFVTGGGISPNGISLATPEVAALGRTAVEISRQRICLAPHEKLGVDQFVKEGPITDMDLLITDEEASMEAVEAIQNKGVRVLIAKSGESRTVSD